MKILYIPLDERPCNNLYPQNYVGDNTNVELIKVPSAYLGYKKEPAQVDKIWTFIEENANQVDEIVASVEMLFYGGLLYSRIHEYTSEYLQTYVGKLAQLKKDYPHLKLYVFSLIMRTPKYSSSDEEPSYYQDYGYEIFKRKYLQHKKDVKGLSLDEETELAQIVVPSEYINDYEQRRTINRNILIDVIELYNNGAIDFMSIPQDDSAPYGYTALDQKEIFSNFKNELVTYSGADEATSALIARVVADHFQKSFKVFAFCPQNTNFDFIPLYEDRTIMQNLVAHLKVINATLTNNVEEADFVLAYNLTTQESMCEGFEQTKKEFVNQLKTHNENLNQFVAQIKQFVTQNKKVIVCDSAYANGGDLELIKLLKQNNLIANIFVYQGWNTNCNSLGTALANGVLNLDQSKEHISKNLALNYYEHVIYQSIVKQEVNQQLSQFGCDYFDISSSLDQVMEMVKYKCDQQYNELIKTNELDYNFKIYSPWKRMFELGVEIYE